MPCKDTAYKTQGPHDIAKCFRATLKGGTKFLRGGVVALSGQGTSRCSGAAHGHVTG